VDEAGTFSLLDTMVDAGLNFIDTADVYSRWASGNQGGESETLIGNWLKKTGKRDKIVLATKVGMEMGPDRKGLAAAYIRQAVEDSLARLQTDHIDLYQAHSDDPDTPLADTLEAFADLIQAGKIRVIGASNYSCTRLAEALITSERLGLPRFESVQPEYNLYTRQPFESGLQALVQAQQVGVINYYALASGFLTGKYRQPSDAAKSVRGAKIVESYLDERGRRILQALDEVADQTGATLAEVALAWQIAQPGITAPIASATTLEQLSELIGAARLQLSPEQRDRLSQASAWQ
ncbi:oxidoreductase, aldo/keto reductase family protein, partial [Bordetella holmesii H620]